LENYDVTADLDTTSNQATDNAIHAEASAAIRALAEIFANSKGHGGYRQYVLERIDGELVFRQTEFDAVFEAAMAEAFGSGRKASGRRRIIRLPMVSDGRKRNAAGVVPCSIGQEAEY
jgi:hypothetical protein